MPSKATRKITWRPSSVGIGSSLTLSRAKPNSSTDSEKTSFPKVTHHVKRTTQSAASPRHQQYFHCGRWNRRSAHCPELLFYNKQHLQDSNGCLLNKLGVGRQQVQTSPSQLIQSIKSVMSGQQQNLIATSDKSVDIKEEANTDVSHSLCLPMSPNQIQSVAGEENSSYVISYHSLLSAAITSSRLVHSITFTVEHSCFKSLIQLYFIV
ncbi:hypothetical protein EB796_014999 [Bugula neritina]|uniref:Uncharacterized protein n=1 Tax=Bugula neritina TaxID=10212 RepID=A0A7J7JK17_BUGNE|nr:hypothetical protein EB796_014999 [Bugula neritina]